MDERTEEPEYLLNCKGRFDDAFWVNLEDELNWYGHELKYVHQETKKDAIGKKDNNGKYCSRNNTFIDPENGSQYTPDEFTPYIDGLNNELFNISVAKANGVIAYLADCIQKREITPQFIIDWGVFKAGFQSLHLIKSSKTSNVAEYRRRLRSVQDKRKRWVATSLLAMMDKGIERKDAEIKLQKYISNLLSDQTLSENFEPSFFEGILLYGQGQSVRGLKSTYTIAGKLSASALKAMRGCAQEEFPPIFKG